MEQLNEIIRAFLGRIGNWDLTNLFSGGPGRDPHSTSDTVPPTPTVMGSPDEIRASIAALRDGLEGRNGQKHLKRLDKDERDYLSKKLQTLDALFAGPEFQKFSAIELHQSFHLGETEHRLADQAEKNKGLAISEIFRNVLVLLPIFFTWAALSVASSNYAYALQHAPEEERAEMFGLPFLLLWEQDFQEFGGAFIPGLGRPTFSEVAKWDAGIILVAVVLTLWFHHQLDFVQAQRKITAAKVRYQLEEILWATSRLFSSAYIHQVSPSGVTESYGQFTEALTDGTEKLGAAADKMDNASARLSELKAIASNVERQQDVLMEDVRRRQDVLMENVRRQQDTLTQSVQALSNRVDALGVIAQKMSGVANHTTSTAEKLAGLTDGLFGKFDAVADNLKVDRDENRSFTEQMREVARGLEKNASHNEKTFREFSQDFEQQLQASTTEMEKTADGLGDNLDGVQKELESLASRGYSLPQAQPAWRWVIRRLVANLVTIGVLTAIAGMIYYYIQFIANTA